MRFVRLLVLSGVIPLVALAAPTPAPESPERAEAVKLQIALDEAQFRPGKIDGLGGEFTQRALDRYKAARGGEPEKAAEAYRDYVVTEDDMKWIGPQASSPQEQAKLKALLYADLWELVAEKFHCDVDFLHELNPAVKEPAVGVSFRVPNVTEFSIATVKEREQQVLAEKKEKKEASPTPSPTETTAPRYHIVLLRADRIIEVYEGDKMVASFPCTPGSSDTPVPEGTWKVTSDVLLPTYRYDKSVLESGVRSDDAVELPPGPNNPVGIVWMGLNRPSVGMHGTNSPDQIGRNESHGCIRLANWDAFLLSQMIEKGTPVEVR